jgi:uncharacterized protein YkwD
MHMESSQQAGVRPLRAASVLAAAAVMALALAASAPPVGGLGAERAEAQACDGADRGPRKISRAEARRAIVCVINNKRQAHGVPSVKVTKPLQKAGGRHSRAMLASNCFDHQCGGEPPLTSRVHSTSYLPCNCSWGLGENIAWGRKSRGSPAKIVDAWMNSPPHRSTLLSGSFRHVGIGVKWGSPWNSGMSAATYTADFGYKR